MKKRKEKRIIGKYCVECGKFIDTKKDHYVQLNTLNRSISSDEYNNFHFQCFGDYFNQRVENKMRANIQFMQERAMSLFNSPVIKEILSKINGSQIALNMVSLPLNKQKKYDKLKTEIRKKFKNNGKREKNRRKKRSKAM